MPRRYITVIAVSFFLALCAACAELERNLSDFTGTRAAPYSMSGMTEQELLRQWGAPGSSYVDTQGNRHLSYSYEKGTNYGSTPHPAQGAQSPVYYRDTYTEKTKTTTRTEKRSPDSYTTRTETTKTGFGIRLSAPNPAAYTPGYAHAPVCTTTFIVRDGIVRDYRTWGPCP